MAPIVTFVWTVILFTSKASSECTVSFRSPDMKPCPPDTREHHGACRRYGYGRGVGRVPDRAPCLPGLRDDGTSCWSDAHIFGKRCCCTVWGCCNKCPAGYHDDGCTCRKTGVGIKVTLFERYRCSDQEELQGHLCYPRCKKEFYPFGCCICIPYFGGDLLPAADRKYCNDGSELINGQCKVEIC